MTVSGGGRVEERGENLSADGLVWADAFEFLEEFSGLGGVDGGDRLDQFEGMGVGGNEEEAGLAGFEVDGEGGMPAIACFEHEGFQVEIPGHDVGFESWGQFRSDGEQGHGFPWCRAFPGRQKRNQSGSG